MLKYGSDKPDLRNPILIITDVTEHFAARASACSPRSSPQSGGVVRAIPAPARPRGQPQVLRRHERLGARRRPSGLGYINIKDGEPGGPIAKNHGRKRPPR
jgi:aspartyl-tRNA synthetase